MAIQLQIDRLTIDAPGSWQGSADTFRRLLERALADELRAALLAGSIDSHAILRVDVPPITVQDIYDMQDMANAIARRVVQAISDNPE